MRKFAAVSAGLLALACAAAHPRVAADLAVINANIITVDSAQTRAQAFAVKNGRFLSVGTTAEIEQLIGPQTAIIDARGRTITPGFIDAHLHPLPLFHSTSVHSSVLLGPSHVRTIDDLVVALRAKAAITPLRQLVHGSRYEDTKLGRHPTRWDLDRASTAHPIIIRHSSGHLSVANSYVLSAARITRETPDPAGGAFDRDASGEPNGICRERACGQLSRAVSPPAPPREELIEGVLRRFREFSREGITTVMDARASMSRYRLYQDLAENGSPLRVIVALDDDHLAQARAAGLRTGLGNDWVRLGPIKTSHGNSLSGRTAWLYEPYATLNPATGKRDYYGIPPSRSQAQLDSLIFAIHAAGFQAAVHSNGDREIDMVLNAFDAALRRLPRPNHRHRIEHASVVNPAILRRVRDLGLVLALHSYIWEHGDKMEAFGEHRWPMMHATRSALDLGIPVAGNSDYGVSAADPMLRIQDLVTRTSAEGKVYGPEQGITAEEAIRVWTLGSAYSLFEEKTRGSITPGKLADFVVLTGDPTAVPPQNIRSIEVDLTVVGGRVVYDRSTAPREQ